VAVALEVEVLATTAREENKVMKRITIEEEERSLIMFSMGGFGALAKGSTLKARKELDWFAAESLTQQHPSRNEVVVFSFDHLPSLERQRRTGHGQWTKIC
jgi:hypothetical protein